MKNWGRCGGWTSNPEKLERHANGPAVANLVAEELDRSHSYGGRSVFGWEPPPADSSDRVGATTKLPSR